MNYEFESRKDVVFWIIKNQFGRRNLSPYDRSLLALKLKPVIAEKAKEQQTRKPDNFVVQISAQQNPIKTRQELAKIANVSHDTITKVERIEEKAIAPIREMARAATITINQAEQAAKQTSDIQGKILPKISG